jgi:hypothetical protein
LALASLLLHQLNFRLNATVSPLNQPSIALSGKFTFLIKNSLLLKTLFACKKRVMIQTDLSPSSKFIRPPFGKIVLTQKQIKTLLVSKEFLAFQTALEIRLISNRFHLSCKHFVYCARLQKINTWTYAYFICFLCVIKCHQIPSHIGDVLLFSFFL